MLSRFEGIILNVLGGFVRDNDFAHLFHVGEENNLLFVYACVLWQSADFSPWVFLSVHCFLSAPSLLLSPLGW